MVVAEFFTRNKGNRPKLALAPDNSNTLSIEHGTYEEVSNTIYVVYMFDVDL